MNKPPIKKQAGEVTKNRVRFNPFVATFAILLTGGIGIAILSRSFAATPENIFISVIERSSGSRLDGITVRLNKACPSGITATSDNGAMARFTSCNAPDSYSVTSVYDMPPGYFVDPNGPGIKIGQSINLQSGVGTLYLDLYITPPPPNVPNITFNASPATIVRGSSATLSWNAQYAASCTGGGGWSGSKPISGNLPVSPTNTVEYHLSCNNYRGNTVAKVKVSVTDPPVSPPTNTNTSNPSSKPSNNSTRRAPAPTNATVVATSGDTTPPIKPESFFASKGVGIVTLSWAATTDGDIVTYIIERSVDASEWQEITKDLTPSFFEDTSPPEGTDYIYYRVRAKDSTGNLSEAAFAEIDNTVLSEEYVPETITPVIADEKKSALPTVLTITGGVLVFLALGGAVMWYRWRAGQNSTPTATVSIPREPTQPHASKSLKEMVLEDYDPNKQNHPPGSNGGSPQA